LDVAIRPGGRGFCVTNDAAGWAELVARLPRGAIAAIGRGFRRQDHQRTLGDLLFAAFLEGAAVRKSCSPPLAVSSPITAASGSSPK